jgi:hypothetical protein
MQLIASDATGSTMTGQNVIPRSVNFTVWIEPARIELAEPLGGLHDLIWATFPVQDGHQAGALLRVVSLVRGVSRIIDRLVTLEGGRREYLLQPLRMQLESLTHPLAEWAVHTWAHELEHHCPFRTA